MLNCVFFQHNPPTDDQVQSNGILRAHDFDGMMTRHAGEQGICIDHWAALVFPGDGTYSVLSLAGREGSVLMEGEDAIFSEKREGAPGIWLKTVVDGVVNTRLCPAAGKVSDLFVPATAILVDPLVDACRCENPDRAVPQAVPLLRQ